MAYPETFDSLSEPSPSTIRSSTGGISPANTATSLIRGLQQAQHKLGLAPSAVTFTADAGTDTLTSAAHGLANADIVTVSSSGTLPGGLATNTYYFVVGATTNTFQLAATRAGSAIDITSAGSGTHSFIALFSEGKVLLSGTSGSTSSWSNAISLASGSLVLPQSTSIAPTAEGSVGWDTDDNLLKIGTGSGTKTIVDTDSTQTLTNKTLSTPAITGWDGWQALSQTVSVSSGYNKGNREFDLTFSATMANILSAGMRLKVTRGTSPPTQCADLEASSSQYASDSSLTGITFTDDFTCEAWIKPESYGLQRILTRDDGTNGWAFYLNANGQLVISGQTSGDDSAVSAASVQLGKWTHVAATLDSSGAASTMYLDGVSIPLTFTNGANSAITQGGGSLQIGAGNGSNFFDGKVADVRLWTAVRTATQIRDNMNQQLVGNETNLTGYWKLNGDFNDSTSNANNLTAQGGAAATNADNPMNSTEYAIVTNVNGTTVTVFTGANYTIPNMTLSSPAMSQQKLPFGFNAAREKWRVKTINRVQNSSSASTTFANTGSIQLSVPFGDFEIGYQAQVQQNPAASTSAGPEITLSTASNSDSDGELSGAVNVTGAGNIAAGGNTITRFKGITTTAQTIMYLNIRSSNTSGDIFIRGDVNTVVVYAECAHV